MTGLSDLIRETLSRFRIGAAARPGMRHTEVLSQLIEDRCHEIFGRIWTDASWLAQLPKVAAPTRQRATNALEWLWFRCTTGSGSFGQRILATYQRCSSWDEDPIRDLAAVEAITHDHEDARLQFVERFKGDAHTQFKARSFGLSGVRQQERKAAAEAFLEQLVAVSSPLHVFTGGMALRTYVRIQLIEAARNSGSSPFPNEECRRVHQHAMERTDRLGREKYGEPDDRISTRVPEASLVARHAAVLAAAVADLKGPLLQAVRDESLDELERAFVTQMRRKQELSEDCVLVDAVVAGRRTAIETFYCNFFGDVQREAKRYMADEPSREQQVQDLMTELLYPGEKNPLPLVDRYRGDGRLQAFLKKVARDKLRPAKRGSDQDPTLLAETLATEPSQSWSIPADLLNAIREQLNSQEQLCLTSIYWDGLSQAEFARRSGVERWDVSRQHAAILKKVQRLLKQHGVESMDDLCSEEVTADGNEVR